MLLRLLAALAVVILVRVIVFDIKHLNDPQPKKKQVPTIIRVTTNYDKDGNEELINTKVINGGNAK